MKKEFSKTDSLVLKGIAIIIMIFHHLYWSRSLYNGYEISFFPLAETQVNQLSLFFKICVSFFAFVSGYGLYLSYSKLKDNTKNDSEWTIKRLIKTMSGFWLVAILSFIACEIVNNEVSTLFLSGSKTLGIIEIILDILGLSNLLGTTSLNANWWYMSCAILFIISVPIFIKLFKKYGYLIPLAVVIAFPRIIGWNYINSSYISFLFPVLLGIIFAEKNLLLKIANFKLVKNNYINKIMKFVLETLLVIVLYKIYINLPNNQFWEIRYGIIPTIIVCYLYEFYTSLPILKQVLAFLGKHALNMFLIHGLFLIYIKDFLMSFENFLLIALILLLISLLTSIVVELFKKLIKYDNLIDILIK